ncbi:MAG TPA: HAMP domain-containing sensor histidine kinase [Candidatus Paceibacterota bacterium]|nr:HAMP domain-containing sensor histidine kinase [Candidatus Paceibacterota bacterium]
MTEMEKLKETNELRSKLISGAAHSLRTTITNIRWTLQIFLDGDLGPINPEQKEYLEKLNDQSEGAVKLLNELLNIIHAEELGEKKETSKIDLAISIDKIISQFKEVARKKGIKINFEREALGPIKTEPKKIEFIVSNLIDNALRYSEAGEIAIKMTKRAGDVQISVKDGGIGIPAADQAKIFNKFFRSENAKKKENMGTGLGLHITKEMVESLGGKIWFESKENTGTTFYFALPLL